MGRIYAGILGSLAMVTIVARALVHGGGAETTMKVAVVCLFLFAAIGWIIGLLAEQTIQEAAHRRLTAELQALADESTAEDKAN